MSRPHNSLLTKEQLEKIIHAWRVPVKIPTGKKEVVLIEFPKTDQYDFSRGEVRISEHKSTYKKRLYAVQLFQ